MTQVATARSTFESYLRPRTLQMLALGFSSGLPFLLVGNTFGYWLRDEGISLTTIAFISWASLPYSFKFLWAPIIDRVDAPIVGFLGRRRGWMIVAQIVVAACLIAMALLGTRHGLGILTGLALAVAFASATQDIVIDAWRIESARDADELGLLTSAYQFGYRVALLATDALILLAAARLSWPPSYGIYGFLMTTGVLATLLSPEPERANQVMAQKGREAPLYTFRGLFDAIAGPFIAFFRTHGTLALLMLGAISLYRLPDFIMGPIANPFYHDIGLTKDVVGSVRAIVGTTASFVGVAFGGFVALRFGYMRALILGGILQALAIASYASLAFAAAKLPVFVAVMAIDSFGISVAGVALVSYMSSLTSLGYTATQYALLASTYALAGKFLKGFSGEIVDGLGARYGLMHAYAIFFIGAGMIGIPAILLFALLQNYMARKIATT